MSTSVEDNKKVIRRFGDAMNSRDLDILDQIVLPTFVRHCQATPAVNVRSLEEFKEFLRQDFAVFPDSVQTAKQMVAEGDLVAVWATCGGTQQGPMGPFPASGRRMQLDFSAFVRLENGKIAEMWVTWDNAAALVQLGHFPAAPGTMA